MKFATLARQMNNDSQSLKLMTSCLCHNHVLTIIKMNVLGKYGWPSTQFFRYSEEAIIAAAILCPVFTWPPHFLSSKHTIPVFTMWLETLNEESRPQVPKEPMGWRNITGWKFETCGKLPIILVESMKHVSNYKRKSKRSQHVTGWDLATVGCWQIVPKNHGWRCRTPSPSFKPWCIEFGGGLRNHML